VHTDRVTRRDEVLDVALRLFAERGYNATPVSKIEKALGMRPGGGGLYRHVASKQALLEQAVERALTRQQQHPTGPFRSASDALVQSLLHLVDADLDLWKLLVREPSLPIDLDDLYDRVIQPSFDQATEWMVAHSAPSVDLRPRVIVAISALLYLRISQFTYGRAPGGVSEEEFTAVVEQILAGAAS